MTAETITCKAAIAWEAGKPLSIEEVQVAPPMPSPCRATIPRASSRRSSVMKAAVLLSPSAKV